MISGNPSGRSKHGRRRFEVNEYQPANARIVINKKTGKPEVWCGRRNADGGQTCRGTFGTLRVTPRLEGEGDDSWVELEPADEWHRGTSGVLEWRPPRSKSQPALPPRGEGSLVDRAGRLARVSKVDYRSPEECLCPRCKDPQTVNRIDPAALAEMYREME